MKNAFVCGAGMAAALLFGSALAVPPVVNPEQMDMGTDITAKIGKEKSKKNMMAARDRAQSGGPGGGSGGDCGSVNINSNDKKSNSGVKEMFGKQTTTIVTGPVINMASCK